MKVNFRLILVAMREFLCPTFAIVEFQTAYYLLRKKRKVATRKEGRQKEFMMRRGGEAEKKTLADFSKKKMKNWKRVLVRARRSSGGDF